MWTALGTLLGAGILSGGSILGAGIGAASSDYAAAKSYDAQMKTNAQNYQIFKENQAWEERMANTAHQREIQDLRAAGLNPILSATGGSGAAVPNLSAPTLSSPGSSVADKSAIYQGMINSIFSSVNTASSIVERWAKTEKALSEKKQTEKVTDQEVGKRNIISYLDRELKSNAGNITSAGKQVMGLLGDLTRAASGNFKVFRQTFFNNFRQGSDRFTPVNWTPSNSARPIDIEAP